MKAPRRSNRHCAPWVVTAWLLAAIWSALAGAEPRTLITTYTEFPPFTYTDKTGKPAGTYIDIYNAAARLAGYKVRFKVYPTSRTYRFLKNGDVDIWLGVAQVPALSESVLEVPVPPFTITLKLWFMEGTPAIQSLDDIRSGNLVAIEGYTYGGLLGGAVEQSLPFHVIRSTERRHALRILQSGRANYMIDYESPVAEAMASVGLEGLRSHTLRRQDVAFVISKKARNAQRIQRDLAAAYRRIRDATR